MAAAARGDHRASDAPRPCRGTANFCQRANLKQTSARLEFTWNNVRQVSRNPLLAMNTGADRMKTGHLAASRFGPVGSAFQGGGKLILVLYGARTHPDRASEGRELMERGSVCPVGEINTSCPSLRRLMNGI